MLPNRPEVVAALFGTWRAGAVYVPLNPRLTDREVDHILDTVRPAAIITTPDQRDRFPDRTVILLDGSEWEVATTAAPGAGAADATAHDADIALIQFTSGTTGRPKAVLLKHSGVLTLLDGVLAKLRSRTPKEGEPPRAPMPNLIPVSLSLWAGLYNVLFAMRVGAPVIILERFETRAFADVVARHGLSSTVLPPAAMAMLSDDEAITTLAPLRFVRSITAPLSPLQARRFKDRFGIAVLNCYGQTEIGGEIVGWNAADSREHGEDKLGAVGRPHEGVELRTDEATGELQVRTPALSAGYADGADLGDRLTDDGWFRTGDVGRIDAEGFLWIEGRVSDMINRGGLKVHPGEVEEVIRLDAGVADVAVVGVPDDRLGEVPWAFVVDRDGTATDGAALRDLCRANLAPYKTPARFVTVDALPRNEVGKVLKRDLTERAETIGRTAP
jgi:acyl-CoA synthetase (AMP-forming)/AMP-acid ligase II